MAECHPVGFQWVMEAKARGAKVIHIDPRFTRTSAVADAHVPLRAGSDIAFLGGIVNYILQNEKYFREYVVAYTNAATLVREDFEDTDDLDGAVLRLRPETGTYDSEHLALRGPGRRRAADLVDNAGGTHGGPAGRRPERAGQRRHDADAPPATRLGGAVREHPASEKSRGSGHELGGRGATLEHARSSATRRCSTRARSSRCSSGTTPATPRRWSRRCAASRRSCSCRSARTSPPTAAASAPRPGSTRWAGRTTRRRAVHPRLGDHPAAAGQHGPARRRDPRAARARQHPGLDRHPDPVQPAARLPADAEGRRARHVRGLPRGHREPGPEGLLDQGRRLHRQPAQVLVGRRGHRGQRLRLRLPAAPHRRPRHLPDRRST